MFTGIIKELGKVIDIKKSANLYTLKVESKDIIKDKKIGDSIAVNGVCLTVTKLGKDFFEADIVMETLKCTNLGELKVNDFVNLEASLVVGDSLDGHFVLGHIDKKIEVLDLQKSKNEIYLVIEKPLDLAKYIVKKGSITINGVSLTIADSSDKAFTIALIPHTLNNTGPGA